jgi:hypothetical protein
VHQHRLALAQLPAAMEGEVRGVVVEDEPGSLLHRERLRQGERHRGIRRRAVCEAARGERHDPLARLEAGAISGGGHRARHLPAQDERQGRLLLVLAAREQQVPKRKPAGVHVDQDASARLRLRRVGHDLDGVRAGELLDLQGAHERGER